MRALPEKTLEHWVSREVARRFPNANLWWPSNGEDVMVDEVAGRPGKWLMLEVKTTEWEQPRGRNRLSIDLEQLRVYLSTGMPVFYVFPVPPWDDVLTAARPWLGRWRRGDLGNPAVGGQWFAHWTYVLSAKDVANVVGSVWKKNKYATLFTSSAFDRLAMVPNGARTLNQFLTMVSVCGDYRSQAAFVVPSVARLVHPTLRTELAAQLRTHVLGESRSDHPLAHYLPPSDGNDADGYRQVEAEELSESIALVNRGTARLLAVSIDASDLALA